MTTFNDLLNESKRVYREPYEVQNFLSQEEVEYCIGIYRELPIFEPASHDRATRKDYLMHDKDDTRIRDLILPKLQALFPDQTLIIDGGNFTDWHSPVRVHTDGYQIKYKSEQEWANEKQVLGFAVLVPLTIDSDSSTKPDTIFFDQTSFGRNITPIEVLNKEHSEIDNYTHKDFEGEYEPKLSHNTKEHLYGFSVQKVMPWTYGNAIVWHRSQFHCAANYQNYSSKLHMVFFLNFELKE